MNDYLNELVEQYMSGELSPEEVIAQLSDYLDGELVRLNYSPQKFTVGTNLRMESLPNDYHKREDVKKIIGLALAIASRVENNGGKNKIAISKNVSSNHHNKDLKKLREIVNGS